MTPSVRHRDYVLAHGQRSLWYLQQLDPGAIAYNEHGAFQGSGTIDHASLRAATHSLAQRHAALRSAFPVCEGEPVQRVYDADAMPGELIREIDVQGWSPERITETLEAEATRPYDLETGPLFRVRHLRGAPNGDILLIGGHHIVTDFWSIRIIIDELTSFYEASLSGHTLTLPMPARQVTDYAEFEAAYLSGPDGQRDLGKWCRRLDPLPETLELPTIAVRPRMQSFSGRLLTFDLDAEVAVATQAAAAKQGATAFELLLAVFGLLLARYSKQDSFALGVPSSVRPGGEWMNTVGNLVNALTLRIRVDRNAGFTELLRTTKNEIRSAAAIGTCPLSLVVEKVARGRSADRPPLFQVACNSLSVPRRGSEGYKLFVGTKDTVQKNGLQLTAIPLRHQASRFDLTLMLGCSEDGIHGRLEYCTELFDSTYAAGFARHFENLLRLAIADPAVPVGTLSLLDAVERERLSESCNRTQWSQPRELCLQELLPEASQDMAVLAGGHSLDYPELHARARAVSLQLHSHVHPEQLVAVVMEKGWEQVVAVLGVLGSGAAYLPIDPALPAARLEHLLQHAQVQWVITQSSIDSKLTWPPGIRRLCVDTLPPLPGPTVPRRQRQHHLAYVIYTSGSTGLPKGVMIEHAGAVNTIEDVNRHFEITRFDRTLLLSSLSFDLSVYDIFGALAAGAAVVIPDAGREREPEHWVDLIARQRVTIWNSVPALMEMLVEYAHGRPEVDLGSLRLILLSGDWIPVGLVPRIRALMPHAKIISLGGATEASIWSITYPIGEVGADWKSIPYGKPMRNQRMHVLDEHLEPQPVWVRGDLYIGGVGLARGYWRDEQRTAASFVVHPQTGERLYRTGDQGRRLVDGNIEFLGRNDTQVKIRGYRIELGEIEAALLRHPHVREAVVDTRDAPGGRQLAAYVIARPESPVSESALREHLAALLPAYMLPAVLVLLERMPLTANGKIDRTSLTALALHASEVAPGEQRTANATEAALREIWQTLLDVPEVGLDDDFFQLGGHSLLAIRLVALIREQFGCDLSLRSVVAGPTISAIAIELARLGATLRPQFFDAACIQADALAEHAEAPFPLSDMQYAYWLGESLERHRVPAHLYIQIEFPSLEPQRLVTAFDRLIARHDALRTVVQPDGTQLTLQTVPSGAMKLHGPFSPELAVAHIDTKRAAMIAEGPSMGRWPAFEAILQSRDDGACTLQLNMCLGVCDGRSAAMLLSELTDLYTQPEAPLKPLRCSLRQYRLAQAASETGPSYARARDYWLARLDSLPSAPQLPLETSGYLEHTRRLVRRTKSFDPACWDALQRRCANEGVTASSVLCAAYGLTLAAWSAQPSFCLNVLIEDRRPLLPGAEQLIANFSSNVLLEIESMSSVPSFVAHVRRLQDQLWRDLDHLDFSGIRVVRELNRHRRDHTDAVMPVVFASTLGTGLVDGMPVAPLLGGRITHESLQTPHVWIDHSVMERGGTLILNWDVDDAMFPVGLADKMFGAYVELVERLAEGHGWHEAQPLPIPETDRQLSEACNQTQWSQPHDRCLQALLPEASRDVAVLASGRTLDYPELDARARAVALHLYTHVHPEQLVAVVMEKGWEQVVGVLGVLGSGAAYLPIDPALPPARLEHLLEHARVQWVVTQSWVDSRLAWPPGIRRLCIDTLPPEPGPPLPCRQGQHDLAYVIYTSGSTGIPKGVMIEHHAVVNTIQDVNRRFEVTHSDRTLLLSSLSFDLSVYDIFGALEAGAAVVIPDAAHEREPEHWVELIARHRITIWNSVPALMEMLVEYATGRPELDLSSLRLILLSGDWIPVGLVPRICALIPHAKVISLGGATEASIWSIMFPIGGVAANWKSIPYGKPMRNQRMYVLDEHLEPRPVWVPGDLYIGGVGLARGYWRDEQRTAASFVIHPETRERLYRTGDQGRRLLDGNIEFLGRNDTQVKIRGYRIELGEIEAALLRHSQVREAVVDTRDALGGRQLVAYVVARPESSVSESAMREHLAANLPAYMIPAMLVLLECMPLTSNGKVDRAGLANLALRSGTTAVKRSGTEPFEREVAALMARVLEVDVVDCDDDFFALGGTSLVAIRLLLAVEDLTGIRLPVASLFRAPTPAMLARRLRDRSEQSAGPLVTIRSHGNLTPLFLAHPVGGSVMAYVPLAEQLGSEQPVYALQAPGLEVGESPMTGIPDAAQRYLQAMRQVQTQGPVQLGGWSMGGLIAFEMARQLAASGAEVGTVIVIDSPSPTVIERTANPSAEREANLDRSHLLWFTADLLRGLGHDPSEAQQMLSPLPEHEQWNAVVVLCRKAGIVAEGNDALLRRMFAVFKANAEAIRRYRPDPYPGRVLLVRAAESREDYAGLPAGGWEHLAAQVDVVITPGDHYTAFRPDNLGSLTRLLRAELARRA